MELHGYSGLLTRLEWRLHQLRHTVFADGRSTQAACELREWFVPSPGTSTLFVGVRESNRTNLLCPSLDSAATKYETIHAIVPSFGRSSRLTDLPNAS